MTAYLVIGGGISGLAAAEAILDSDPAAAIQVLEGSDRVGGKLRAATVAGVQVDAGAEAMLARRPEGIGLVHRAGLGEDLVHPTDARAQIFSRGRLHQIPGRTMMGVPADPSSLSGLLTAAEVNRAAGEVPVELTAADTAVGDLVSSRLGAAVTDRLVEPLLGGVYAGHAALLSARAALPVLASAAREGRSLTAAVAGALPTPDSGRRTGPVFAGVKGGLHRLPAALARRLSAAGVRIQTGTMVRELHRLPAGGYEVVTGPRPAPTAYRADRVVLALPPAPAARLLRGTVPQAAELLVGVESASMAVLTFAFDAAQLGQLPGSGVLIPPAEGLTMKASTFSMNKWDWVREAGAGGGSNGGDVALLRVSIGRHREEASLHVPDGQLAAIARTELGKVLGRRMPEPVEVQVQRWGGGLPQYAVGHLDRIAAVREALAGVDGLAAGGAVFDGVGVPACIASARRAVADLLAG